MASLGRLTIDMVANLGGFESDLKRASRTTQREMGKINRQLRFAQRDLEQTRARVTRLAGAITALGGIALTGTVREFRKLSQEADRIQKLGIQTGLTAEAVQELSFAAEQSGSSMEAFTRGVIMMQRNIQNANDGLSTQVRSFERMGIQIEQLRGLSADQQFALIADAISQMTDETQRNASALEVFGRSATDIIPLLSRGSAGIEAFREQMRATGSVMSQDTVDAAAQFNDAMNVLTKQLGAFKVAMFADVIEPLAEYADFLANTTQGQEQFRAGIDRLIQTAKIIGTIVGVGFTAAFLKATAAMLAAEIRVGRLTAQKLALAGATRAAATSMALFGRAVSIATGPIGIAVGVLGTLFFAMRDVQVAGEDTAAVIARVTGNIEAMSRAAIRADIQALERKLRDLSEAAFDAQFGTAFSMPDLDLADEIVKEIKRVEDALKFTRNQLELMEQDIGGFGSSQVKAISMAIEAMGRYKRSAVEVREETKRVSDEGARFLRRMEDLSDTLAGGNASALRDYSRQVAEATRLFQMGQISIGDYGAALHLLTQQLNEATRVTGTGDFTFGINFDFIKKSLDDVQKQMQEIAAIEWGFENLIDSFHPLAREMRMLGDAIELVNDRVENGKMGEMPAMFMKTGMAASAAFGAIMEGMDRSSKEYKQMAIAQEVVNTALGIAAILQQGQGDPYSAFARMAAMAAMVASLGVNVANMSGGGGGNVVRNRQDAQGTGTVLGDLEAKSESIANAIETTADATSSLVGISRGMLNALHAIQQGISGAAGMVARGALDIDMSGLSLGRSDWGLTNTKLVDQGIALMGGAIADMTSGAVAQAFAESRRSNLFSTRYRTVFEDLDDAFNDQVNLIFRSMIDTVEAAGVALGIPLEEIQARIARFEVEAQQISLMDLTAEEQRAELEAVFSAIFDDLAASVVPFIGQFQKIGEGMGEALVRVATGVQVMQEAISRLGFALDAVGPEAFAQASEGLIELAGGLDQFIESMGTFFDKFAPEARKFEVLQSDLTRALEQAGLAVPETRDAMWDLMQSLDATTEEGREQIATLLRLAEVSDAYYSMLEEQERERLQRETRLAETMRDIHDQTLELISPAHAEYNQLAQEMAAQIRLLQELGASERQVADLRRMHTLQMQAFAAALRESIQSLTDQLFNTQSLEQASQSVGRSMNNIRDQIIRGIEGVQNWLDRQLLGPTSSLLPVERLEVSGQQFFDAINAVQGGDLSQFGDLPGMADAFLRQASTFHGTSTAAYREIELMVRSAMESIADIDVPDEREQIQSIVQATQDTAMSAAEQVMLGSGLLQQLAVLSRITGDSPADIAKELGVPIGSLMEIMGDVPGLTGDALETYFNDVVLAIDDEVSLLMDMKSIEQAALDTLLRIERIFSDDWTVPIPSDMGIADMHTGGPVIGDGVRNLQDGEYVVPRAGALVADTGGWDRLEQRMASVERLLERQNELTDEEIAAIRQGSAATVTHLKEQSSAARSRQARPAAPRELNTP